MSMSFALGRAKARDCWSLPTRTRRPRFEVPAANRPDALSEIFIPRDRTNLNRRCEFLEAG
jgi:hypothetical protein